MILQNVFLKDAQTGEVLVKFVGHLNVVNAVAFAPLSAYPAIRMLAGQEPVSVSHTFPRHQLTLYACRLSFRRVMEGIWLLPPETTLSFSGIARLERSSRPW